MILGEGAVRWPLGSTLAMADQVEHLVEVSELPISTSTTTTRACSAVTAGSAGLTPRGAGRP
ncbi:MAG: Scr1 family TA system antitoxin-like transcriptional regulator [Pseudonocardia sp.]